MKVRVWYDDDTVVTFEGPDAAAVAVEALGGFVEPPVQTAGPPPIYVLPPGVGLVKMVPGQEGGCGGPDASPHNRFGGMN